MPTVVSFLTNHTDMAAFDTSPFLNSPKLVPDLSRSFASSINDIAGHPAYWSISFLAEKITDNLRGYKTWWDKRSTYFEAVIVWQQVAPHDYPQYPSARYSVSFFLEDNSSSGELSVMQLAFLTSLFADNAMYLDLQVPEAIGFAFAITEKGVYGLLLWNASAQDIYLHASHEAMLCPVIDFDCPVTTLPHNEDWNAVHHGVELDIVESILQMAKYLERQRVCPCTLEFFFARTVVEAVGSEKDDGTDSDTGRNCSDTASA